MSQNAAPRTQGEGPSAPAQGTSPLLKLLIEGGPLLAFFVANRTSGIYAGTAVFMVAIVLALAASWRMERRLPVMPLVTAAFVLVFGGLTLYLQDDTFIKIKPTIVNGLFAATLLAGLWLDRPLLKHVLGTALQLDERGWLLLTKRWALFFAFLAALNELVWRNFSGDNWLAFKTFGIAPLSMVFMLLQLPLIRDHAPKTPAEEPGDLSGR